MITLALALSLVITADTTFTTGPVELVADEFMFTEGPLWRQDGVLLFSDIPADKIYRDDKTVYREPSGQSNGLTFDLEGRVLAAEHAGRRVSREEKDGTLTVVAAEFEGKRFNSPNDVIVRSDGMIFFTDPPYGLEGGLDGENGELHFSGVFSVMPGEAAKLLVRDFLKPNGLTLSPDEKTLYVADSEGDHIRAFDVAEDGSVSNDRVFCEIPGPDGIKTDTDGNVWATAGDGVRVIGPTGDLLETIAFPSQPANCAFGGEDGKTLYATARKSVYKVPVSVKGIFPVGPK